MGGLAVLAREAGHKVTGCDAGVYPPMSTQLEAQGIELIEGYGVEQLSLEPDLVRHRQCRHARQSADGGDSRSRAALHVRAAVARRARAERQMGARGRRHARQDDDEFHARVAARRRRAESGLPDRRRAAELRHFGAADRFELLRDRSRRIRHRFLRQALEVRPLPAAHGGAEQPRIRSRRHLPRSRRDRNAIPSSRAHRAGRRAHRDERSRGRARTRADARLLVGRRALRRRRRLAGAARRPTARPSTNSSPCTGKASGWASSTGRCRASTTA